MKPWRERNELERRRIRRQVEQDFLDDGYRPDAARELARLSEEWADQMDPPDRGDEAVIYAGELYFRVIREDLEEAPDGEVVRTIRELEILGVSLTGAVARDVGITLAGESAVT